MQIQCIECDETIHFAEADLLTDVSCPSCGSQFPVPANDATITFRKSKRSVAQFELLEQVGVGAYGTVWRARDTTLDRVVAVKIPRAGLFDERDEELFFREARAAARLSHPNIVTLHEVGRDGETVYIVSDFVSGPTLKQWLDGSQTPVREVAEMCVRLAEAMQHAHDAGVVHRDLKPSNILIDGDRQPHITDFGLAKRISDEASLTVDGELIGTPAYMSPEQASGRGKQADNRSDVYSLGVILYEMLTGEQPFTGAKSLLLHRVMNEDPQIPRSINRQIPRDLETICLKAMSKLPSNRYDGAGQFAEDLGRYLAGRPIVARRTPVVTRIWRWCRRHAAAVMIGILSILAFASGAALYFNDRPTDPPDPPPRVRELTTVLISTDPPGARILFVPLDQAVGKPLPDKAVSPTADAVTPTKIELVAGEYLVIVEKKTADFYGFHEVFRTVPQGTVKPSSTLAPHLTWTIQADGSVVLPRIKILPEKQTKNGLAEFPGGTFRMGTPKFRTTRPHEVQVKPFLMAPTEVTVGQYRKVMKILPESSRGLADRMAVRGVKYDAAVVYAEKVGLRIAAEAEYEYAATAAGTRAFPWGDELPATATAWKFGPVGEPRFDHTDSKPPVYGLFSNVAEWTTSWSVNYLARRPGPRAAEFFKQSRVVRSGTLSVMKGEGTADDWSAGPRYRHGILIHGTFPGIGFRCVRSKRPRFLRP